MGTPRSFLNVLARAYSVDKSTLPPMDKYETFIFQKLNEQLDPSKLSVQDVSGGCGSMFAISIVSEKFKGISMIKQHRLVNSILSEEIKKWHGIQLVTKAPK